MEAVAEQLASSTRRIAEDICENYTHWAPQLSCAPSPGDRLHDGFNHHVQLIESSEQRWVLRVDRRRRDSRQREQEITIQTMAAARQIAPKIHYSDSRRGITVMDWIDVPPVSHRTTIEYAALLRTIHTLTPVCKPLASTDVLQSYLGAINTDSPLAELISTERACIDTAVNKLRTAKNSNIVLCHNDLLRANCLHGKDRLYAIDWEYAAPGDPLFDLAVCASDLSSDIAGELLELYLQRPATPAEQQRFDDQGLIYACIEACWFNVHDADSDQAALSYKKLACALSSGAIK